MPAGELVWRLVPRRVAAEADTGFLGVSTIGLVPDITLLLASSLLTTEASPMGTNEAAQNMLPSLFYSAQLPLQVVVDKEKEIKF
jgi:hypothetical protein